MNKKEFLKGEGLQPYTAPEMDFVEISVEQGFSLSDSENWGDGGIGDDNWNNMGDY